MADSSDSEIEFCQNNNNRALNDERQGYEEPHPHIETERADSPLDEYDTNDEEPLAGQDRSPPPRGRPSRWTKHHGRHNGLSRKMLPRGPNIKLKLFSGDENFEEFIDHFEINAELGCWDLHSMNLALRSCLTGRAQVFISRLPTDIKSSYRNLVEALRNRFTNKYDQPVWVSSLKARKRGSTESIASFADALSELARKAYSDLSYNAQERMALDQLYNNLCPELQYKCIEKNCSTIDHAVSIIQTYESVLGYK